MSHWLELALDEALEDFEKALPPSEGFRQPCFGERNVTVPSAVLKLYNVHCVICSKTI